MSLTQHPTPRQHIEPKLGDLDVDDPRTVVARRPQRRDPTPRRPARGSRLPWILGAVIAAGLVGWAGYNLHGPANQAPNTPAPASAASAGLAQTGAPSPQPAPDSIPALSGGSVALVNALAALHAHDYRSASAWAERARARLGDTPAVAEVQANIRSALAHPGENGPKLAVHAPRSSGAKRLPRVPIVRPAPLQPKVAAAPTPVTIQPLGVSHPAQAAALVDQANIALANGNAQTATALLAKAAKIAPALPALQRALANVARAGVNSAGEPAQEIAGAADTPTTATSSTTVPVDPAAVQSFIARAAIAAQHGDIASPPGRSAYDLYMQALSLDGSNATANAGLKSLPAVANGQFRTDIARGDLADAGRMFTAVREISPDAAIVPNMRAALHGAWVDRATHYSVIGEPQAAQRAREQAQRILAD